MNTVVVLTNAHLSAFRFAEEILSVVGRDTNVPSPSWPRIVSVEALEVSGPIPKSVHIVGVCSYGEGKRARFGVDFQMDLLPPVEETWAIRSGIADLSIQFGGEAHMFKVSFSGGRVENASPKVEA